ncbi:LuxR C-terminal-related transcriptional regulator [Agromyces binzhouensis]|uniref:LuxR C-terminal-related transcriptional regulator n=1 Tax=Agromyces binzhouensis TaxID=1817495 RepID=UPI0036455B68
MDGDEVDRRMDDAASAVAEARWEDARLAFTEVLAVRPSAAALDGLGRALWWIGETAEAIAMRTRAYTAYRRAGRDADAARIATWLAIELASTPGREAIARGWLGRAERLASGGDPTARGWFALARSTLETDPVRIAASAEEALAVARDTGDAALEIRALGRSGLGLVRSGRTDAGIARLDEAMAAASAGEAEEPEVFAETCCDMVAACYETLDGRRLEQWGGVAERFLGLRPHPTLLGFCGSCCAGILAARGDTAGAERWLTWTIDRMETGGHASRCVEPAARLAELRVAQGRLEEAERLVVGVEGRPECVRAVVGIHLARGETGAASSVLHRRLGKVGADSIAAIPVLAMLVPVQVDRRDLAGAETSVDRISRLAAASGDDAHRALADVAAARLRLARGEADAAGQGFRSAAERYDRLRMPPDAARARVLLAEALAASGDTGSSAAEARAAAAVLDRAGLVAEADEADALSRSLGGRGRVGPKRVGTLTKREREVLLLVAEGLTNAEIAERLHISPVTAGHHVSNVLGKLGVRSRTEAAMHAHLLRSG